MSDLDLLLFGCLVSFIAGAGAYVVMRERFAGGTEKTLRLPVRDEVPRHGQPQPARIASKSRA